MRKILTSKILWIGLLVVGFAMMFLGSKNTTGFSWFGLWTQKQNETLESNTYVQKDTTTDIVVGVIVAHNSLFGWVRRPAWGQWGSVSDLPSYLASSQNLLGTDIITYLENASNKETALDTYIWQLDYYQSVGQGYQIDMENTIQEQTNTYTICAEWKKDADALFYQGLYWGDQVSLEKWLEDSQTNGVCQTKARIIINANKAMLARAKYMVSTTTNLSTILQQNRSTIITNFELFKDSYLEKLITVRNQLRAMNAITEN